MIVIKWSLTYLEIVGLGNTWKIVCKWLFINVLIFFIKCILGINYFRNVFHKIVKSSFAPVCPTQPNRSQSADNWRSDVNVLPEATDGSSDIKAMSSMRMENSRGGEKS